MTHTTDHLPAWAYRLLALAAGAVGIAASVVTAKFFIVGLQLLETDAPARDALIAAGGLMIVTELAAFFLAALLPAERLRALRVQLLLCAGLLLAFECATIYLTQRALNSAAEAQQTSLNTRIQQAQSGIEENRQTAAALRENSAAQSSSKHPWVRQDGAATLQRAVDIEQRTAALAHELAGLQMQQRPTVAAVLGHAGMLAYSVARALLVSGMGLVMCGAAGALLRSARQASAAQLQPAAHEIATALKPDQTVAPTVAPPVATVATVAAPSGRWRSAAIPLASVAVAPTAFAVPPWPPLQTVAASTSTATATVAQPDSSPPSATGDDDRYRQLLDSVRRGDITPSVRAMHAAVGGSTLSIRAYQQQLLEDGVIEKHGQGYRLRPSTG